MKEVKFMALDYSSIFACFVDMIKTAIPISIFLHLAYVMVSFFFSLAFPKFARKGD